MALIWIELNSRQACTLTKYTITSLFSANGLVHSCLWTRLKTEMDLALNCDRMVIQIDFAFRFEGKKLKELGSSLQLEQSRSQNHSVLELKSHKIGSRESETFNEDKR